ncbi:Trm112 family protein [Colwellia sp. 20A7]|uniref:Trm112 family protein n=1 Tax=Colwellia sp. 20A7 TaxID=2689569 RepID=UPI00135ACAF8|nr:Trm112 family protein [Colwellia sp. 20A7]
MAFDVKLMEILACPVCKGKLDYNKEQQELICKFDKLAYVIEQDIPVLLESEARRISLDDSTSPLEATE